MSLSDLIPDELGPVIQVDGKTIILCEIQARYSDLEASLAASEAREAAMRNALEVAMRDPGTSTWTQQVCKDAALAQPSAAPSVQREEQPLPAWAQELADRYNMQAIAERDEAKQQLRAFHVALSAALSERDAAFAETQSHIIQLSYLRKERDELKRLVEDPTAPKTWNDMFEDNSALRQRVAELEAACGQILWYYLKWDTESRLPPDWPRMEGRPLPPKAVLEAALKSLVNDKKP